MKDDYFKTLGIMMCVMYAFSAVLSLSFVIDDSVPFMETLSPVLRFINLSLGVSFVIVSIFFVTIWLRNKIKTYNK